MRILFAGSGPARLSGGSLMALLLARELVALGHEAELLEGGAPGAWSHVEVPVRPGSLTEPGVAAGYDAVVTGSLGVEAALESGADLVCQLITGYEPHLWPARREHFGRIFRLPTLKLVITPHIAASLREDFDVDSVVIGAPVELGAFAAVGRGRAGARARPGGPLRALTVGPEPSGPLAPVPFKGIARALGIVELARREAPIELVRLTPREDDLAGSDAVDELHVAVPPREVPPIYGSCDVYVGASTAAEGLGMPAFEAACAGQALLLPAIPSYREVRELERCALFYEPGADDRAAELLARFARDEELRSRLAAEGPRAGFEERFSPRRVAGRMASAIAAARA